MSVHDNPLHSEPNVSWQKNPLFEKKVKHKEEGEAQVTEHVKTAVTGKSISLPENKVNIPHSEQLTHVSKKSEELPETKKKTAQKADAKAKVLHPSKELKISQKRYEKGVDRMGKDFEEGMKLNLEKYQNQFNNFESNKELRHAETGEKVGLTAKQLMKVTAKGLLALSGETPKVMYEVPANTKWVSLGLFKGKVQVTRLENGEIIVNSKKKGGTLGKGSFGIVESFKAVNEGKQIAIKSNIPTKDLAAGEESKESLIREHKIVTHVHKQLGSTKLTGIRNAARTLIAIAGKVKKGIIDTKTEVCGLMDQKYNFGSGKNLILNENLKGDIAISVIKQVTQGLVHLSNANVVHRDAKTENLLVNEIKDENGKVIDYEVDISDFGVAHRSDGKEKVENDQYYYKMGTPEYKFPGIDDLSSSIAWSKDPNLKQLDKLKMLHEFNDLYGNTVALYEMLTGIRYTPDAEGLQLTRSQILREKAIDESMGESFSYISGDFDRDRLEELDIPETIINLMQNVLTARFTAEQVMAMDKPPVTAQDFVTAIEVHNVTQRNKT